MNNLSIRGKIATVLTFPFVFALLLVFLVFAVVLWTTARIFDFVGIIEALKYQISFVQKTINRKNLIK